MKVKLLAIVVLLGLIMITAGLARHYHNKYQDEQKRADAAEWRAESTEVITANVFRTVTIMSQITEANQHAKSQIALESSRASRDIKAAVANDVVA